MSVVTTCSATPGSMENVSNNLGKKECKESRERMIGNNSGKDEKQCPNYYTATDMLNTMNRAMQEFSSSGQDGINSDPKVELHQRMPDGSTIPVDTSTRKATDTQMKLKQVTKP
jgi:hypothetical protein